MIDIEKTPSQPGSPSMPTEADEAEIDYLAEKKLVQKLDCFLIPVQILALFGRLYSLEKDLRLYGNQFQGAVSILFVTYILSELPSNLVLKKSRPSR